jgi:Mg-chelatase subunit ChlD
VTLTPTFTPVIDRGTEVAFRVEATGEVPTTVARAVGYNSVTFRVHAEAVNTRAEERDIVFVLDTTDSMEGTPLAQLKNAVNLMLDDLDANAANALHNRVGVVPFAQYVNVGMGFRNAPWIDVPNDYQNPTTTHCSMVNLQIGTTNCRSVLVPAQPATPPGTCYRDGRPYTCGGSPAVPAHHTTVCDPVYDPIPTNQCHTSGGDWVRWHGCVGSRNWPLETQDGSYHVKIPGLMGVTCGSPILLPTFSATARHHVNALTTNGSTFIPSGLIWGWRMLSEQEPLAGRPRTGATPVRKIMVLVTDGMNTVSPTYPAHNGSDTVEANTIMRTVCDNMAADTVTRPQVFTVAFEVTDPTIKGLLQHCARVNGGDFYDATTADQLRMALQNIGRTIYTVRLTR